MYSGGPLYDRVSPHNGPHGFGNCGSIPPMVHPTCVYGPQNHPRPSRVSFVIRNNVELIWVAMVYHRGLYIIFVCQNELIYIQALRHSLISSFLHTIPKAFLMMGPRHHHYLRTQLYVHVALDRVLTRLGLFSGVSRWVSLSVGPHVIVVSLSLLGGMDASSSHM